MPHIYFQASALIYTLLITSVFFSKKNSNTLTNLTYVVMLLITMVEITVSIVFTMVSYYNPGSLLSTISSKLYYWAIVSWIIGFTYYIFALTSPRKQGTLSINREDKFLPFLLKMFLCLFLPENKKAEIIKENENLYYFLKYMFIFLMIALLADITILIMPIDIEVIGNDVITKGMAAGFGYGLSIGFVVLIMIIMLRTKKITKEASLPALYRLHGALLIGTIVQMFIPKLPIITVLHAFASMVIYYTVENPDLNAIEELNITTKQAEAANAAKSDFLSSMSHEIRTPLNAIVGFSRSLAKEKISGPAKDEVKEILNASTGLLETINGILDISKLESNKVEITNDDYSTKRLLNDIITVANNRMGSKMLELRFEVDEKLPPVLYGDSQKIKQIILNLLTNSIKYTQEGHILLKIGSLCNSGKCVLSIQVEDTGIGMTKEDIDVLFVKFQRFDLDQNINIAGTGLGMAITKNLVELMDGDMAVRSEYGEGTTFTIVLEQEISDKVIEEAEDRIIGKVTPFNASGQKVMVVDDNKINLKVAERILDDYNVEIELVQSGFDCISKVKEGNKYDLILLDIMMPKMKGTEVLVELKKLPGFKTPIVALTADVISGMEDKYINEGFDDCLPKPIVEEEIFYLLKRFLKEVETDNISTEESATANTRLSENNTNDEFDLPKLSSKKIEKHELSKTDKFVFNDLPEVNYLSEIMNFDQSRIFPDSKPKLDNKPKTEETKPNKFQKELEELKNAKDNNDLSKYAKVIKEIREKANQEGYKEISNMAYEHELAAQASYKEYIDENYNLLKEKIENIDKD